MGARYFIPKLAKSLNVVYYLDRYERLWQNF
jgi:hypothetical protein